jgi:hypothetical protein
MSVQFNNNYQLSIWRPKGILTLKEIIQELEGFVELEMTKPPFDRFANLSEADFSQIKYADIRQIYLLRKAVYTGLPVKSVFYVKTDLQFGIARIYQTLMEETPIRVEIFKNIAECAQYLNVPIEIILPPE